MRFKIQTAVKLTMLILWVSTCGLKGNIPPPSSTQKTNINKLGRNFSRRSALQTYLPPSLNAVSGCKCYSNGEGYNAEGCQDIQCDGRTLRRLRILFWAGTPHSSVPGENVSYTI
ncbi:hypothetical protein L798_09945 [Zootermopsis nevadensis]|uniref:Uncharacterized protein n=1 Tax=Zootermopsis nevadensis TaxID=136037 RepID=A0A067QEP5_ZOONE|nr:hypothetical protein L798_09945 [Zootermopsis nevadensis]